MKRISHTIPIVGVVVFIGFYLYSSVLYPGGTRFDHTTVGYDHIHNFWCDLLDISAFNGQINPARTSAQLATVILSLSLIPFCYNLINIFEDKNLFLIFARWLSILAMIFGSFMLVWHDVAINLFVSLNILASIIFLYYLIRRRKLYIILSAMTPFILCIINFLMWRFDNQNDVMPLVQKLAIGSTLTWICFMSFKLLLLTEKCNSNH